MLGLARSWVGLEEETLAAFDSLGAESHEPLAVSPVDEAEVLDAIPAIVAAGAGSSS